MNDVAVGPELILEGRQLGGAHHVVPVGVDPVDLVAEVELGEPVHVELRLGGRVLRRGGGGHHGQHRQQEHEGPQSHE